MTFMLFIEKSLRRRYVRLYNGILCVGGRLRIFKSELSCWRTSLGRLAGLISLSENNDTYYKRMASRGLESGTLGVSDRFRSLLGGGYNCNSTSIRISTEIRPRCDHSATYVMTGCRTAA